MSKKMIIISIVAVLLVAAGVTGFLIWSRQSTPSSDSKKTETKPDLSKDYGSCKLLDKDFIQSTLGDISKNLSGPDNLGRVYIGNGDESQFCIYSFVPGGNIANTFNKSNSFNVEIYAFKNTESKSEYQTLNDTDTATVISDLGDSARFVSADKVLSSDGSIPKQTESSLTVYSGLKYYRFAITQPASSKDVISADKARLELTTLAKSVSYSNE